MNAGENDAVIFTGTGCTGAVHKLIHALDLESPTVMVGPHQHHSSLLPWREVAARVVNIRSNSAGQTDLDHLEQELSVARSSGSVVVGCFSAASNVTGVLEDDLAVTAMLHKHGALAFWDYAAAAPYVDIDMNPKIPEDTRALCSKDAIFFSMHKFVGGVQTPGVLVAKKKLFQRNVPDGAGGGSVFFVSESDHRYLQEPEMREEGGTPDIVGSVRAGLVMKLKQSVGPDFIMTREEKLRSEFINKFQHNPNIVILGVNQSSQLPIFSFLIRHAESGLFLHYNYVVALLNDLFGLQTRGGCACAGPYMQHLLGMSRDQVREYETVLVEDSRLDRVGLRRGHSEHSEWEVVRPGSTRLNLSWWSRDEETQFILSALEMVVNEGWKLLPVYRFNNETGEWRHHTNSVFRDRKWLGHVSFISGQMNFRPNPLSQVGSVDSSFEECLGVARQTLDSAVKLAARETVPDQTVVFPDSVSRLRWFLTPSEAKSCLLGEPMSPVTVPWSPPPAPPLVTAPAPGSLSGSVRVSAHCSNILRSAGAEQWIPDKSRSPGLRIVGRQSIRRPEQTVVSGRDSVTVNAGTTSVSINTAAPDSISSVNGYKNVIRVSSDDNHNHVEDEKTELSFDDEDDSVANVVEVVKNLKIEIQSEQQELSDRTTAGDCENGVCVIPGGKRKEDAQTIPNNSAKWRSPSKEIFKPFIEAVTEFKMIADGDKVLVCLSGGKDSLSLLHCVQQYQFYARSQGIHFQFGAVTVDPMSSAYDPRPLIPYLKQLGVEYFYEQQDIMGQALETNASSICAFCSRMKRGRIYAAARKNGYNVLALGQHLDDLTESFFMSIFHNGRLRTMKASYTNAEGDLRIIRPLVYAREKNLRKFAEASKLPVIAENCPACFEAPKERQRIKQLLAQQELLFPRLYWNLKTAIYPVMKIDKTGVESVVFGKGCDNDEDAEEEGF